MVESPYLLLAYCVEKLAFPSNGSNFSKSALSKPLFLLSHVSAETSGNPRYGVFQHNRPEAAINTIQNQPRFCSAFWLKAAITS
jgi:hypothetical protein